MKATASVLIILFISSLAWGESNDAIALKARKAYDAAQFEQAIKLYEDIVKKGYESAILYYNLGNAYFRNNEISSAILYYEKALKLKPNSEDIRHNIAIANSRIIDKVEIVPELFYKRWWKALIDSFSINSIGMIAIVILFLTLLSIAIYLLSRRVVIRKMSFWTGISLFILLIITFLVAQQKEFLLKNHSEAIVFSPTVTVKSSPDDASADIFVIHEGIKVLLLDQIGDWQEIRIANGSIGWLKSSDIRFI